MNIALVLGIAALSAHGAVGQIAPHVYEEEGETTSESVSAETSSEGEASSEGEEETQSPEEIAKEWIDENLKKLEIALGGVSIFTIIGWVIVIAKTVSESGFKKKMKALIEQSKEIVGKDNLDASLIAKAVSATVSKYEEANQKTINEAVKAFASAIQYYSLGTAEGNKAAMEALMNLGKAVDYKSLEKQLEEIQAAIKAEAEKKEAEAKALAEIAEPEEGKDKWDGTSI